MRAIDGPVVEAGENDVGVEAQSGVFSIAVGRISVGRLRIKC